MAPDADLQGADRATVERALADRDPLPGTGGFAGTLGDGRAVRDALGRYPLFTARGAPARASADPRDLDTPVRLPAGTVRSAAGDERVWSLPDPEPFGAATEAIAAVRAAVRESVGASAGDGALAVAFSGGVDSATLAARCPDAPLYVAGFPDSPDVVAAPLVAVARRARGDGFRRLAVGQGADELFGGYDKVARAPDDPRVDATTVRGAARELVAGLPGQLERDVLALRAAGVEPVAPLLHDRVVRAALRLPGGLLVNDRGERKVALRLAAREWLPDRVAFRPKRAAQYGSRAARELDRLAREAGFERRAGDHVARFLAAEAGEVPTIAAREATD